VTVGPLFFAPTSSSATYLEALSVTPICALSLTKVYSSATVAIRVRRSSDNAEQDIGFSGTSLDTSSLATFVGSNSAFVTKIYDQSGHGLHAVQATAANQPRIVNAGVYDGFVRFDGTDDGMKITSLTLGTPQFGLYSKFQLRAQAGTQVYFETTTVASSNSGSIVMYDLSTSSSFVDSYNAGSGTNRANQYLTPLTLDNYTVLADRSVVGVNEIQRWKHGTLDTPVQAATTEQTGNYLTNDFYIGSRANSSLFSQLNLVTLVLYNADTSGIRTSIESYVA
jgi:hypothetical protein